uniref:Uncharacterized protein n=1 Tax=Oreochromis aureus TaxID=47969 RepID=A0AAZ1WY64_OREAU
MAENRVGRQVNKVCGNPSPCRAGGGRDPGQSPQRRRALVTVTWIDRGLDRLYRGREEDMPEEVNIDELLDLKTDEERTHRLLIPPPGRAFLWSLHVLLVSAWALSGTPASSHSPRTCSQWG